MRENIFVNQKRNCHSRAGEGLVLHWLLAGSEDRGAWSEAELCEVGLQRPKLGSSVVLTQARLLSRCSVASTKPGRPEEAALLQVGSGPPWPRLPQVGVSGKSKVS